MATDAFTGTTNDPLTTYSGNWALNSGNFDIQSNALAANGAASTTESMAHWTADTPSDDQAAQAKLAAKSATFDARIGVGVRIALDNSANGYGLYYDEDGGETYLYKLVGGVVTQLGASFTAVRSVNEQFRLEVIGSILEYKLDSGSGFVSQGTRSDSTFASGSYGVSGKGTTAGHAMDDWLGESLGVASPAIFRSRKLATQQRMGI